MKKIMIILSALVSLSMVSCGPSKDDPIKDYKHLNTTSKPASNKPTKEYVYVDKEVPVIKEVPVERIKEVIVTKEVPVEVPKYYKTEVEQVFARDQLFQVSRPKNIKFIEGEKASFEFTVKIIQGKVNFEIDISDLPKDAEVELLSKDVSSSKYKLSWTPTLGHIDSNQSEKEGVFFVALKNLEFVSEDDKENKTMQRLFKAISNMKEVPYVVRRTSKIPKVTVVGLFGDQNEGVLKKFHIDVKAPGTYENYLPNLNIFYNMNNVITDKGAQMNGALYVRADEDRPKPEKVDEQTWRYFFVYDTLNYPMQAQFDNKMKPIEGAGEVLVQFSIQAFTPFGTSSDQIIRKFAIKFKTAAPKDVAPIKNTTDTSGGPR